MLKSTNGLGTFTVYNTEKLIKELEKIKTKDIQEDELLEILNKISYTWSR